MADGIIIRDAAGNITLDGTYRVGSFFGSFHTNNNETGSFTDSSIIGTGTFFAWTANQSSEYGGPVVTGNLSTGLVEWSYEINVQNEPEPAIPDDTVFYGVF